jgi:hypothetical protein
MHDAGKLLPEKRVLAVQVLWTPAEARALCPVSLGNQPLNVATVPEKSGRLTTSLLDGNEHPGEIGEIARIVVDELRKL